MPRFLNNQEGFKVSAEDNLGPLNETTVLSQLRILSEVSNNIDSNSSAQLLNESKSQTQVPQTPQTSSNPPGQVVKQVKTTAQVPLYLQSRQSSPLNPYHQEMNESKPLNQTQDNQSCPLSNTNKVSLTINSLPSGNTSLLKIQNTLSQIKTNPYIKPSEFKQATSTIANVGLLFP